MDIRITKILEEFQILPHHSIYVSSSKILFEKIYNLVGYDVGKIVCSGHASYGEEAKFSEYFYTREPVNIYFEGANLAVYTFYENGWYLMLISNPTLIDKFLDSLFPENIKKSSSGPGYTRIIKDNLDRLIPTLIMNDSKFEDLVGVDEIRDTLIRDIDGYFNNIEKYRSMGMNRGINIILWGPPGVGKTSFVKALSRYYWSHLVVVKTKEYDFGTNKVRTMLNPKISGKCIVLVDDYDGANLTGVSQAIFDEG